MSTNIIFQQLAQHVHHHKTTDELISSLPESIRCAYLTNNIDSLKQQLSSTKYFANESHVVQINTENNSNHS